MFQSTISINAALGSGSTLCHIRPAEVRENELAVAFRVGGAPIYCYTGDDPDLKGPGLFWKKATSLFGREDALKEMQRTKLFAWDRIELNKQISMLRRTFLFLQKDRGHLSTRILKQFAKIFGKTVRHPAGRLFFRRLLHGILSLYLLSTIL